VNENGEPAFLVELSPFDGWILHEPKMTEYCGMRIIVWEPVWECDRKEQAIREADIRHRCRKSVDVTP
jgi:hypothetical protein